MALDLGKSADDPKRQAIDFTASFKGFEDDAGILLHDPQLGVDVANVILSGLIAEAQVTA